MIRALFYLLIILITFVSCEYELHEEYVNDIEKPDASKIHIQLNPNKDEYTIYGDAVFLCEALTQGIKIYQIKAYVDGIEINNQDIDKSSFTLRANNYAEGKHTLSVEISTNTGTGSIADILGAEGFIFNGSWDLYVDKSPPEKVNITRVFNEDGIVRIEWQQYPKDNFESYHIIKIQRPGINFGVLIDNIAIIKNQNQTYCYDSNFVGGEAKYLVQAVNTLYMKTNSDTVTFVDSTPAFSVKWESEDVVTLNWDKCKYNKSFKAYKIAINYDTTLIINNINTTSVTGHFGVLMNEQRYNFAIQTKVRFSWSTEGYSSEVKSIIGDPFREFTQILKYKPEKKLFVANGNSLKKYDPQTNVWSSNYTTSNGSKKYVLSPDYSTLLCINGNNVEKININSFTGQIIPNVFLNSANLSASNIGIASNNNYFLYDFRNLSKVSNLITTYQSGSFITNDSKYMLKYDNNGTSCYKILNNTTEFFWSNPANEVLIIPDDEDNIIGLNNDTRTLSMLSIQTNQNLWSLNFENGFLILQSIDPETNILIAKYYRMASGFSNHDELWFIDYSSGQIKKKLKMEEGTYYFFDNMLYMSNGYKMEINF